jgi:hypothetical protein
MVRDYNPLTLFLPVGGILMLTGIVMWGLVLMEWLGTGVITRFATVVGGTMLFLGGMQIAFFGLMADIVLVAIRSKR